MTSSGLPYPAPARTLELPGIFSVASSPRGFSTNPDQSSPSLRALCSMMLLPLPLLLCHFCSPVSTHHRKQGLPGSNNLQTRREWQRDPQSGEVPPVAVHTGLGDSPVCHEPAIDMEALALLMGWVICSEGPWVCGCYYKCPYTPGYPTENKACLSISSSSSFDPMGHLSVLLRGTSPSAEISWGAGDMAQNGRVLLTSL